MAKALIGVTTTPASPEGIPLEGLNRSYVDGLVAAGAIPVMLPVLDPLDVDDVVDSLDGLLLPGGGDVEPASYGAMARPELATIDEGRDAFELALVRAMLERERPILGMCRGMQVLNVAFGGTLHQHLPLVTELEHRHGARCTELVHQVDVLPSSQLAQVLGVSMLGVNSLHHQAPDSVGRGLRAVAWSDDGIVEGLESVRGAPVLGVQWHPELLTHLEPHARLFAWLAGTASGVDVDGRTVAAA